ncbi:MAG: hypothetical protein H8E44_47805 [Planctomycetes bacterium]|nr:hypothetical protein [Planctomycetota bacterium]MBL7043602.1 hypothetical protein [Pirellulaceae bacterium]
MSQNELESSLVETIASSDLSELKAELLEAAADTAGLPVLKTLHEFFKGVDGYFYTKKVLRFLSEVRAVPKETRQKQVSKMLVVPGERERFGEHLALLLDRMNDIEKARMMGRVATAFLQEKISIDDLKSLNFALDAFDLRMADSLEHIYENDGRETRPEASLLANCGLLDTGLAVDGSTESVKTHSRTKRAQSIRIAYSPNRLGRLFVDICLR